MGENSLHGCKAGRWFSFFSYAPTIDIGQRDYQSHPLHVQSKQSPRQKIRILQLIDDYRAEPFYVHSGDTCDLHTSPDLRMTGDCSPCQINLVIITHVLLKATKATRTITLDLYRRTLTLDLQRGPY